MLKSSAINYTSVLEVPMLHFTFTYNTIQLSERCRTKILQQTKIFIFLFRFFVVFNTESNILSTGGPNNIILRVNDLELS